MDLFDVAIAKKMSGGGGNPNTVQTVTGTAAEPFGNIDLSALSDAISNNEATAILTLDMTQLAGAELTATLSYAAKFRWQWCNVGDNASKSLGYDGAWTSQGDVITLMMWAGSLVTDGTQYASAIPSTLTVIWHPLS